MRFFGAFFCASFGAVLTVAFWGHTLRSLFFSRIFGVHSAAVGAGLEQMVSAGFSSIVNSM